MDKKPVVALLGTLDTKGEEYAFLKECLDKQNVDTLLIDAGVMDPPGVQPDIGREEVAKAAGTSIDEILKQEDRGKAVAAMARGAKELISRLYADGAFDGIMGMGGSGGSVIVSAAMRALPVGVPKLLVSTLASGDTRPYVGTSDICMMYSVVDISGINRISAAILRNAAASIAGMVKAPREAEGQGEKPIIGATMFGVTTPCLTHAREKLEELGYEVLVFHAVGVGGQTMESLIRSGYISAVLDATTTELADEVAGGTLSAGPDRLEAAGEAGIPQVVSLGAVDMANFGPVATVPEKFKDRKFHIHNDTVTLMRTTPEENSKIGRMIAEKLNAAKGATALFIPLKGVSAIDVEGGVFYDKEADDALFNALRDNLDTDKVELIEMDCDVNAPEFAEAMAAKIDELYRK